MSAVVKVDYFHIEKKKGLNHTHYLLIKEQIADKER